MATNQIVISSFQGGLANDRNRGQKGAFWDAQGIEIRKNSEYASLNRGVTELFDTGNSPIVALATTNYYGSGSSNTITDLENEVNAFCSDGKIFDSITGEINMLTTVTAGVNVKDDSCVNIIYANSYNYILGENYIWRFQNRVAENILPADSFSSGWTGTNWSAGVHTPGSTVAYTQSIPLVTVSGERYHIVVDVFSQSAGTCTVSIGGQTSGNLATGRNDIYITTSSTAGVSFTPSNDSTIDINYIRVDRVSDLASSNGLGIKKIGSLTAGIKKRPVINFYGDLIIGDGTQVARYNKDGTIYLYSATVEAPVIGGLDGTVYAITQIGTNVYVWCNNGGSTNMYIWDGLSSRPTQKVTYADKPVINVALLNNQHYWWAEKGPLSQKHILIGEGYQAQRYISSDIPKAIATETLDDPDRLAIYGQNTNAIETFGDIVYLPGYGKIFGFGGYFPGDTISLNKEFTFSGTECTAMLTTTTAGNSGNNKDFTFYMLVSYLRSGSYYVGAIDFRDYNGTYVSSGYIETMEYIGENLGIEKNSKKLLVPFYLPDSSTSIKVYERRNQASSYTLIKTIDTTSYGTGFNTAEISHEGKWNTIQYKFELITSSATYSPRLYVGITDILTDTANRNG